MNEENAKKQGEKLADIAKRFEDKNCLFCHEEITKNREFKNAKNLSGLAKHELNVALHRLAPWMVWRIYLGCPRVGWGDEESQETLPRAVWKIGFEKFMMGAYKLNMVG